MPVPPVLPAYAGMILGSAPSHRQRERAPRVCGDDPVAFAIEAHEVECSPRMRG